MGDSPLIQSINDFICNRKMNGYKTDIYERYMQQFIDYCNNRDISFDTLSGSILTDYCYFRDETEQTKRARMNMMIQYATYLKRNLIFQCQDIEITVECQLIRIHISTQRMKSGVSFIRLITGNNPSIPTVIVKG